MQVEPSEGDGGGGLDSNEEDDSAELRFVATATTGGRVKFVPAV